MRFYFISARWRPFEIGARLVAALAFPAVAEAGQRRRAALAWCTEHVRQLVQAEPHRLDGLRNQFPLYFQMSRKEVRAALRTTFNRLDKRILAGKMARGIFQEHETKQPVRLPQPMRRHSLNELSKLILKESHQSDPHNVETRIWGASRPVIHLASGYDLIARALPADQAGQYDMSNLKLHQWLIRYGEWAEPIVAGATRFGISLDHLLRVRLK